MRWLEFLIYLGVATGTISLLLFSVSFAIHGSGVPTLQWIQVLFSGAIATVGFRAYYSWRDQIKFKRQLELATDLFENATQVLFSITEYRASRSVALFWSLAEQLYTGFVVHGDRANAILDEYQAAFDNVKDANEEFHRSWRRALTVIPDRDMASARAVNLVFASIEEAHRRMLEIANAHPHSMFRDIRVRWFGIQVLDDIEDPEEREREIQERRETLIGLRRFLTDVQVNSDDEALPDVSSKWNDATRNFVRRLGEITEELERDLSYDTLERPYRLL